MAVAIPVVDSEVILRRILKGDPSMSSSWSLMLMESALWVIATEWVKESPATGTHSECSRLLFRVFS